MRPELEALAAQETGEIQLTTGLTYGAEGPVVIRIRKQDQSYALDDEGAAVRQAGNPDGWTDVADGVVRTHGLAVDPDGVVSLADANERDLEALTLSVADTSLALYSALRNTDVEVGFDSDTSVE